VIALEVQGAPPAMVAGSATSSRSAPAPAAARSPRGASSGWSSGCRHDHGDPLFQLDLTGVNHYR
jgi:hypothetical protein